MAFIVGAIVGAGASIVGGALASRGARDAANTAAAGSEREIAFNRESRDLARSDQAPYREAGYTALDALMSMTGLGAGAPRPTSNQQPFFPGDRYGYVGNRAERDVPQLAQRAMGGPVGPGQTYNINEVGPENLYRGGAVTRNPNPSTIDGETGYVQPHGRVDGGPLGVVNPSSGGILESPPTQPESPPAQGIPQENPGGVEGGYNFMTDPGYEFRRGEGVRAIERGAAARGGLLSGGTGRALTRYGQDYASNEYTNVYNRISNIAGLGQVASNQSGNAAMYAGAAMGNAASQGANASAYGQIQSGNAWANAANQIGQLPWGQVFNPRGGGNGGGGYMGDGT